MLALRPAKALPLFSVADDQAKSISERPCGPALLSEERPEAVSSEKPAPARMNSVRISTPSIASLISFDCTFLPRYSGVRPTMSPATKTASKAKTIMV